MWLYDKSVDLRPSSCNLLESLNCISLNMYLSSALRFVSDNRAQVLIRTSRKRPPQKRIIKCSLTRIESQLFFFLEGVLTRLLFGREFIACHFESPEQSANGRNIGGQQLKTTPNVFQDVTCCLRLLTLLHVVACCWSCCTVCIPLQQGRNNTQHYWRYNIGSCCFI